MGRLSQHHVHLRMRTDIRPRTILISYRERHRPHDVVERPNSETDRPHDVVERPNSDTDRPQRLEAVIPTSRNYCASSAILTRITLHSGAKVENRFSAHASLHGRVEVGRTRVEVGSLKG